MRAGKIALVVIGSLAALVGLGLLAGGGALVWAHTSARDSSGFYSTSTQRFSSSGYALTSRAIDVSPNAGDYDWTAMARRFDTAVRIRADRPGGAVFVGITSAAAADRYLGAAAHDQLVDVRYRPFEATYRHLAGGAPATAPGQQTIWVARASGAGPQQVVWKPVRGSWTAVVMNADGSPGVVADVSAGVRTGALLPIGVTMLVLGLLLLVGAATALFFGFRGSGAEAAGAGAAATGAAAVAGAAAAAREAGVPALIASGAYPVVIGARLEPGLSRWKWLVKWLLVIPHLFVLAFLWAGFAVLTVAAWFTIVFTGHYPRPIFEFNVGVMRWSWRVAYYAFAAMGTDRYPPFSLEPDPSYPADLSVEYPERLSRGLVWVKSWLLAIPHYLVVGVFGGGLALGGTVPWEHDRWWLGSAGLIGLLVLIAVVALAFTGRYPTPIFDFVMGMNRWTYRVLAYVALMRDEYPPFRLDPGGADPGSGAEPPPVPTPDQEGRPVASG